MRASRRMLMTLPLVLGAVSSCVPRSAAQLTVFDPANFQQNLLSAARALEQINNQVRVLQNQVLMIARMDQNLVRLGGTMSPDLQKSLGDIQEVPPRGWLMASRCASAATQSGYEQLFPKQASAALTHDDVLRNAKARWDEEYAAFQRAALLQGQIADGIETDTGLLATAMGRSRDAVGALEAAQAGNELTAAQRQAGARAAAKACSPRSTAPKPTQASAATSPPRRRRGSASSPSSARGPPTRQADDNNGDADRNSTSPSPSRPRRHLLPPTAEPCLSIEDANGRPRHYRPLHRDLQPLHRLRLRTFRPATWRS